jgi:anti-sigma regulatory factor (Ser/Thr protein kinase)
MKLKQKIAPNYLMRCSNIFRGFDEKLEDIISNTSLELIVNSLTHAEEIAFVGIQRTSNRITISVCDSGVGFPKSLKKLFKDIDIKRPLTHQDGILIGSLIQKSQHGLRLAISEVLNYDTDHLNELNEGWVIISSFNSEIRWQKNNWDKATNYFEKINISKELPSIQIALGEKSDKYIEKEDLEKGYWKSYDNFLLGTRISFEIKIRE